MKGEKMDKEQVFKYLAEARDCMRQLTIEWKEKKDQEQVNRFWNRQLGIQYAMHVLEANWKEDD
jgi:hypothetical protein